MPVPSLPAEPSKVIAEALVADALAEVLAGVPVQVARERSFARAEKIDAARAASLPPERVTTRNGREHRSVEAY